MFNDDKIETLKNELNELKISITKLSINDEELQDIKKKIERIEIKLITQLANMSSIKRAMISVGIIIPIVIGTLTFYYEHILDEPNPIEQQKSIDLLWQKYNKMIDIRLNN